jgi:alpha-glucosidase (family GH31 glycosyl hydrolase)
VKDVSLLPGERWWGGAVADGHAMPFQTGFRRDLQDAAENQVMPLLISNRGRYIWSDDPFAFEFSNSIVAIRPRNGTPVRVGDGHDGLAGALAAAGAAHFPPVGSIPDKRLFAAPQYALWIELVFEPTQAKVIAYAEDALAHGFPPGVLILDEQWHGAYGEWQFHAGRFPDPEAMIDHLHALGFAASLWLVPYVTPDSVVFRELHDKRLLISDETGEPRIGRWWNGYSAGLDLLKPEAVVWLERRLDALRELGVDGFKFDGGDRSFYAQLGCARPEEYTAAWNAIGLDHALNEYRAGWRAAGLPLAQRQHDKHHTWNGDAGLASLIPHGIAQSLTGHAYHCPDMIGGGDYLVFPHQGPDVIDEELFVRSAQCSALFPMMQFSAAPWRVLRDEVKVGYCRDAAMLHVRFGELILQLAEMAARTGEPILRPLAYNFPGAAYETVDDQFMLGTDLLVAPVIEQGAVQRSVALPGGRWRADDGVEYDGPAEIVVDAPLARLPWFESVSSSAVHEDAVQRAEQSSGALRDVR